MWPMRDSAVAMGWSGSWDDNFHENISFSKGRVTRLLFGYVNVL